MFTEVLGVDIVDQTFIQRPGIHLALSVIDDGIAKADNLAQLMGRTCH